jgi:N-acetylmuramoyl-L-alanine amidase
MTLHIVAQGEHLAGIALEHGFGDYRAIWNHSQNAALKKKRQDPNVLLPGDEVFIPDRSTKTESISTEQRHSFQLTARRVKLRLRLERRFGDAVVNTPCTLMVESDVAELTSSAKGQIENTVSKSARNAWLTIKPVIALPNGEFTFHVDVPLRIGGLDPIAEESGQRARLQGLGYYLGPGGPGDGQQLRSAVEEFQCEHGLAVDGKCGPATQDKLKQAYGC